MPTARALPDPPPLDALAATGPVSLFLDFDGTLVDLAETPDGISVPDDLIGNLQGLAARLDGRLALVSGRALTDLERHLGAVAFACAGSHGADVRAAGGTMLGNPARGLPRDVATEVGAFARAHGLRYEAKTHGAALHSRERPEASEAARQFLDALAAREGLAVSHGKAVSELLHGGADKGSAVDLFLREIPFAGTRPIFVGDDVTDEDGFVAARALGGVAIAVGERDAINADYGLADVAAVHHWLWP